MSNGFPSVGNPVPIFRARGSISIENLSLQSLLTRTRVLKVRCLFADLLAKSRSSLTIFCSSRCFLTRVALESFVTTLPG